MYAIVKSGGKQIFLSPGDRVKVEKIEGNVGDEVSISDVLMVNKDGTLTVGRPLVEGASVTCNIVEQAREKKIVVYKYKKRKKYHRKRGHRQHYTGLLVKEINIPS